MEKEDLKKKLDEVVLQIKGNSKDAKFADKLVDRLLSLKGQLDVEAVEFILPTKDVLKEYDFGAFKYIVMKNGVLYKAKGGVFNFVSFRCKSLYELILNMLELKDNIDTLEPEKQDLYSALLTSLNLYFTAPLLFASNDEAFFGGACDLSERAATYNKYLEKELLEETYKENEEFEQSMELFDTLKGEEKDA